MEVKNFAQLKVAGALVLAIVSFGFLVYDADYARIVSSDSDSRLRTKGPGSEGVVHNSAIAVAVFAVFVFLVLIAGIVITLLELSLPPVVTLGLFGGGAVLFLAVLIASAVGISKSVDHVSSDYDLIDSFNYNESDSVKEYVDGFLREKAASTSAKALSFISTPEYPSHHEETEHEQRSETRGWPSIRAINRSKHERATAAETCFETAVGRFPAFGGNGKRAFHSFEWAYTYFPLAKPLCFGDSSQTGAVPTPPPLNRTSKAKGETNDQRQRIYERGKGHGCYGIQIDEATFESAKASSDFCSIELKLVGACAPGWSLSFVKSIACQQFKECLDKAEEDSPEKRRKRLEKIGAKQERFKGSTETSSVTTQVESEQAWVLPRNWDGISDLKSDDRAHNPVEIVNNLGAFYGFNLAFLIVGIVGWLAMIAGLVIELIVGGESAKADE
jgi:hypothetical protein